MAQVTSLNDYRQQGQQQAKTAIEQLLLDAQVRMIETGSRNKLVSTPRTGKRTRSLTVLDAESDPLFVALAEAGKACRFIPADPARSRETQTEGHGDEPKACLQPKVAGLRTNVTPEVLEKRLLSIYRDAKTTEEEQGINILFIAIGFLRWYEDDHSNVLREAPLVLVPVSLVRDPKRATFEVRARDEDVATNQAIQERLRVDFGISLPDLPEADGWRPTDYFRSVREAVANKGRWSVDENGVELGFYSFSKILMIRDLDPQRWGELGLVDHPILKGLLSEGFAEEPAFIANDADLDRRFAPSDLVQVVDADSSQTVVIETVRAGRSLVVQGPPGTGKSQTITNIIAAAVHDGKKVLFVAEKMAALNVVHDRLRKAGLGAVCLELHSKAVNKRMVLAELEETLRSAADDPNDGAGVARLEEVRSALNAAAQRMHRPVADTGLTPFLALSRLVAASQAGVASHKLLLPEARRWSAAKYAAVVEAAERLCATMRDSGPYLKHPFLGVRATGLQPTEIDRLLPELAAFAEAAETLATRMDAAAASAGVAAAPALSATAPLVDLLAALGKLSPRAVEVAGCLAGKDVGLVVRTADSGLDWVRLKEDGRRVFNEAAWATPAETMRGGVAAGLSLLGRIGWRYGQASTLLATVLSIPMPKTAAERLELVDGLAAIQGAGDAAMRDAPKMAAMLPNHWRGEKTDFAALKEAGETVGRLSACAPRPDAALALAKSGRAADVIADLERLAADVFGRLHDLVAALDVDTKAAFGVEFAVDIPLRAAARKVRGWRDGHQRYDEWRRLVLGDRKLRKCSAVSLADALSTGSIPHDKSRAVLVCAFAEAVWSRAITIDPALQEFHGVRHDALVAEFAALEKRRRSATVGIIRARHSTGVPRGSLGQMGVIRSEISRKRGHMPIRKLFKACGETLQRLKPVLLMSPISVAQFLPPASVDFDLLVIDEASQVRPEEALGLVARAKQVVVVGDSKQLPPTSFFDRVVTEDEEEDDDAESPLAAAARATDQESILKLCEARGLNSAMLRWHYRSRHPSLIEVSNAEFYRRLIMPPAPSTERSDAGLTLRRVAGAYDRGGKRNNVIEARAVVDAVAAHARTTPESSLGVVTFSTAQRDTIVDMLEFARRTDPGLDAFMREGKHEDFFVKNLENVQGDERDVVFVSVGYGPRVAGNRLDTMSFGPVSSEGGERRLNVLFTRARSRCVIFSSFSAADIDPDRAKGDGARVFKRFLRYAETGILEERVSASEDADSPFEEAVAAVIEGLGYKVDKQVGSAGFKIDLAVRCPDHPGRYVLAVECDGATYHRSQWARERDRMRQQVLENMGWRFHRIWSTDWFYRKSEAIQKIKAAIEEAGIPLGQSKTAAQSRPETAPAQAVGQAPETRVPAYEVAAVKGPAGRDPGEMDATSMALVTKRIVEVEGPIHRDEIARRVAAAFDKQRTSPLITASTLRSLDLLKSHSEAVETDGFWMTPDRLENPRVRDRSAAPSSVLRADMIPAVEIHAAARLAETENGALTAEEMLTAVTRLLGFKRTGPELRLVIEKALAASDRKPL